MSINELAERVHRDAKSLGWYDEGKVRTDLETLMMVVTELAEAVDEIRDPKGSPFYISDKGKPEGWGVEVADAIIRLLDFCAYKNLNIQGIIDEKLKFNLTRGYRHGNKLF
jgi:hypothetical protein